MSIRDYSQPVSPTRATVDCAQKAVHELNRPDARFALVDGATGNKLPLSEQACEIIRQLLADLAQNRPVAVVPLDQELTPNQAADILNVSRGTVLRLIENGALTARLVGSHRRIRVDDLLAYKRRADLEYDKNMDELVGLEQDMGLD